MNKQLLQLSAVVVTLVAASALAQNTAIQTAFSDRERELIVSYSKQQAQAPADAHDSKGGKGHKGKSKDKGLPPGIAMNLERGKPLPPGIAKNRLPNDLVVKLPPPPKGHEIVVVDGRVLLVDIATQVIRDKLEGVILR